MPASRREAASYSGAMDADQTLLQRAEDLSASADDGWWVRHVVLHGFRAQR